MKTLQIKRDRGKIKIVSYYKSKILACFHCQKKEPENYTGMSLILGRCPKCKMKNQELYAKIKK